MLLLTISAGAFAQVQKINIQASGLTCSMCSNSINKSLKTIDFVDKVMANIKNSTFEITVKAGSSIDFDLIKKKVEDAGFFVAALEIVMQTEPIEISDEKHLTIDGLNYHFMHTGSKTLKGLISLKLIDKGFVSAKVFKKNARYTTMNCYQTGKIGGCCAQKNASEGARIYHVTL
jgi:copper chaperone CopZ